MSQKRKIPKPVNYPRISGFLTKKSQSPKAKKLDLLSNRETIEDHSDYPIQIEPKWEIIDEIPKMVIAEYTGVKSMHEQQTTSKPNELVCNNIGNPSQKSTDANLNEVEGGIPIFIVNKIFQCAGQKKVLQHPTIENLVKQVHLDKTYDKNRIAATRMRIIRILKDWTNDGAKLKYVVTTEEAKNMDKFVAEKNKIKTMDNDLRNQIFENIDKIKQPCSTVLGFVNPITNGDKEKRRELSKYITNKLIKSWKKDKAAEKFGIPLELAEKVNAQVDAWRSSKTLKTRRQNKKE